MQLDSVRIPPRLRGFDDGLPAGQAYDVQLDGARVGAIRPSGAPARGTLLPALVDAHVHLDKTYLVERTGAAEGDLFTAIGLMAVARAGWTASDLEARMSRAIEEAWRAGTRALRTHLDWHTPVRPVALDVFERLRSRWAGKVELQFASLTTLDLFADAFAGEEIALEVAASEGVLGAFVYRNEDLESKLRRVFDLAIKNNLALDFHVDEGLHADATGLKTIAELTVRTGHSQVTCSHCCSLSVQPDAQALDTLDSCARAGIHLIALPTTNLYLQGAWDRTPVERGLTRLREAAGLGLRGSLATDNVADAFYPYGSYDLLESFSLGLQVGHLAPAEDWLDTVTTNPARAMGLAWDGRIAPGCPADLVLLAARNGYELPTLAGRQRTVIREGRPL